jgi:hypothetical protein
MGRKRFGERQICKRCEQDIEWHGRNFGWIDRGAGRSCLPYIRRGEVVRPQGKHTVRQVVA